MSGDAAFHDDFDGPGLDTEVWVPHYLPMWSSRAESAATYAVGGLRAAADASRRTRASGARRTTSPAAGLGRPVGRVLGPGGQHRRPAAVPRRRRRARGPAGEWGWTPRYGRLEVRARMELSPRSMAAVWMVGLEDEPDALRARSASSRSSATRSARGRPADRGRRHGRAPVPRSGAHRGVRRAERCASTSTEFHVYAADWRPGRVDFLVDGEHVRTVAPGARPTRCR